MIPYKKPNLIVGILFIYTTGMYLYFFPKNTEMDSTEKWLIVAVSYILLIILWFVLRRKKSIRDKYKDNSSHKQ